MSSEPVGSPGTRRGIILPVECLLSTARALVHGSMVQPHHPALATDLMIRPLAPSPMPGPTSLSQPQDPGRTKIE